MLGITRESLKWLAAELIVVVLGILIAFQIDEWRSELGNRDRVATALEAILSDLDVGEREYDAWLEQVNISHQNTNAFVQLLWNKEELDSAALTPHLQLWSYPTRYWAPTATAFNGTRDNGDFAAIRDIDLQKSLVYYFDVLEPFLLERRQEGQRQRSEFLAILMQTSTLVPDAEFAENSKFSSRLVGDARELKANVELNNALVRYHQALDSHRRRIEFGKSQLNNLRTRIEEHLVRIGKGVSEP